MSHRRPARPAIAGLLLVLLAGCGSGAAGTGAAAPSAPVAPTTTESSAAPSSAPAATLASPGILAVTCGVDAMVSVLAPDTLRPLAETVLSRQSNDPKPPDTLCDGSPRNNPAYPMLMLFDKTRTRIAAVGPQQPNGGQQVGYLELPTETFRPVGSPLPAAGDFGPATENRLPSFVPGTETFVWADKDEAFYEDLTGSRVPASIGPINCSGYVVSSRLSLVCDSLTVPSPDGTLALSAGSEAPGYAGLRILSPHGIDTDVSSSARFAGTAECMPSQWLDAHTTVLCGDGGILTFTSTTAATYAQPVPQVEGRTNFDAIASPDGKTIMFQSCLEQDCGIFTVPRAGGQPTKIAPAQDGLWLLTWQ